MANIYDVAKRARVSVATVSAVVNESAYVSPHLKARVLGAIRDLGYKPNLLARSLAKKQSHTLGVIVPDIANRGAAARALHLRTDKPVVVLCPGAEYGPAKRWPPTHFADLAARMLADGAQVWIVGSPNDKLATYGIDDP